MISANVSGSFKSTEAFLAHIRTLKILDILNSCGQMGVSALANATPTDSSLARSSWGFTTSAKSGLYSITWTNHDVENGFPVAVMLQYGYATGTGGFVEGRDYINPAMRPIFDQIADKVWKAVISA